MESETEASPLLQSFPTTPRRRNICSRIPSEVTITGIILGLFLIVVTLLIVLENLESSSKEELTLDTNLLASPLKSEKKFTDKSLEDDKHSAKENDHKQVKKVKNWLEEWRKSYNVEIIQGAPENAVSEDNLLGSPFKYDKKALDNAGKDKKKEHTKSKEHTSSRERDNVDEKLKKIFPSEVLQDSSENHFFEDNLLDNSLKSTKKNSDSEIKLLGSPFKYNKKALDNTWQDKKKDYTKSKESPNIRKWDNVDKGWKKISPSENYLKSPEKNYDAEIKLLGSPFKYNKKALDNTWQDKKEDYTKSNESPNIRKWDNVDKGWKKLFPSGDFLNSPEKNQAQNDDLLGSPFMIDREEYDKDRAKFEAQYASMEEDYDSELGSPFMIDREEFDQNRTKFAEQFASMKWDSMDEGWKSMPGIQTLEKMQTFYDAWKTAVNKLKSKMNLDYKIEKNMVSASETLSNRSVAAPSGCPFANLESKNVQAAAIPEVDVNCALLAENVQRALGRCVDISFLPKECKPSWRKKCFSTYKYRTIDGTCNNQMHPTWGKSATPYVRMIAADYNDGASSIRTTLNGGELPNARLLSQKLYTKKLKPDIDVTLLFLSFGLIIDHDMVDTAINAGGISCCEAKFEAYSQNNSSQCLPIDVPKGDPFYGPRNVKCLNFVRSLPTHGRCVGRREQLNKATSFLDGSAIYGSTIQKSKSLRTFSGGKLRTQRINNAPYMSFSKGSGFNCGTPDEPLKCFEAGDSRVNMLVELTAMHTLWYREHNRLAEELSKLNPQWIDETLFQEARRILIAELQHITYNEFLPLLLGEEAMDYFQLNIKDGKYFDGYDATVNPSIYNVFGAAAFRFGHSLLQDMINLVGADNKMKGTVALRKTYFNPQILYHNGLDLLLRGAASEKLHSVDSFITNEVREHLFQPADKDFGHDLAAIGIQRGRDHGLPSYTKWRSACGLPEIKVWDDLLAVMNAERAKNLKEVYQSVEDIDLIPGALAENHMEGSLLGPTYVCIIGKQFMKTRKGDRFWFEMQDKIGSFTNDQLKEIYKSNMARIVCDNSDRIQEFQKHPFRVVSSNNSVLNCEVIPKLDLSKWKASSPY